MRSSGRARSLRLHVPHDHRPESPRLTLPPLSGVVSEARRGACKRAARGAQPVHLTNQPAQEALTPFPTLYFRIWVRQETPDEIPEGETPATATVFAFDDLVDAVRPGDRCGGGGLGGSMGC